MDSAAMHEHTVSDSSLLQSLPVSIDQFSLNYVLAAHDCRQRYVVQAFLWYLLTMHTTAMHHDVRLYSWILHNLMLGIS